MSNKISSSSKVTLVCKIINKKQPQILLLRKKSKLEIVNYLQNQTRLTQNLISFNQNLQLLRIMLFESVRFKRKRKI